MATSVPVDLSSLGVKVLPSPLGGVIPLTQVVGSPVTATSDNINLIPNKELRADLIWGDSGHGKDQQLWTAVYYVAKVLGKRSLLLTGESLGTNMQNAQDIGLVDVISIAGTDKPMDMVAGVLKGKKWPVKKTNSRGEPILDFKDSRAIINPEDIGLIMINSMTSLGDLFKLGMQIDGAVRLPMSPGKDKYSVTIDGVSLTGSAPTHVGFVHDRMYEYVVASTYLPVDKVLWTARQQLGAIGEKRNEKGEVIKIGVPVFGPQLPGYAATAKVTSWFGGAYHVDKVAIGAIEDKRMDAASQHADKMKVAEYEYRLYLERHIHPDFGAPFDAKNRLPAIINSQLLKPTGPTGGKPYVVCTERKQGKGYIHTGINTVWEMEENYKKQSLADAQEDLAEVLAKLKR